MLLQLLHRQFPPSPMRGGSRAAPRDRPAEVAPVDATACPLPKLFVAPLSTSKEGKATDGAVTAEPVPPFTAHVDIDDSGDPPAKVGLHAVGSPSPADPPVGLANRLDEDRAAVPTESPVRLVVDELTARCRKLTPTSPYSIDEASASKLL